MAPPPLKKGEQEVPPVRFKIYRARATDTNGQVAVWLTYPSERTKDQGTKNATWVQVWEESKIPLNLGDRVKAYSPAGKLLSKETVLKALANKVSVACFERRITDDPERPDPIYAALFRDDAVLLVLEPHR
jgi:hypothetical protein